MNEYIFYTNEGYTESPIEGMTVENCQMLGRVMSDNIQEARIALLKENSWIEESGFDIKNAYVEQILTGNQKNDIALLIDHFWEDEKRKYEKSGMKDNHIFNVLSRLKQNIT